MATTIGQDSTPDSRATVTAGRLVNSYSYLDGSKSDIKSHSCWYKHQNMPITLGTLVPDHVQTYELELSLPANPDETNRESNAMLHKLMTKFTAIPKTTL